MNTTKSHLEQPFTGTTIEHNPFSAPPPPPPAPQLQGSCVHCRRRKVRCDKQSPCANCVRFGTQCELAPRKRAPRRPKKAADGSTHTDRELELMRRLNNLEGIVKELSGHVETDANGSPLRSPDSVRSGGTQNNDSGHKHSGLDIPELDGEVPIEKDLGTLMLSDEGRSRYVHHNFFSRLTEEVDDLVQLMFEDYKDEEDASSPETNSTTMGSDHQSFVFGYASSRVNLRELHPLPSQLPFYLQMYAQRVDPLVKLLHIPSMEVMIKEAAEDLSALSRSAEALIFALYFAVISSMSIDEVKSNFALERKVAYDRYRFGVEQALARANFLDTSDLATVQAFVLYLTIVRCEDESRVGWALTRSAIGVAQSLGLHRDGTVFGLAPFEAEMRRRLWWQLCVLDFRLSEKHGTEPSIMDISFDTKRPLNINDSDLLPDATVPPEPRIGLTQMTITLIACEISAAAVTLLGPQNDDINRAVHVPGKEERIRQFCKIMDEKYVKYCTDGTATAWIASTLCKLVFRKLESIILLPLTRSESKDRDPQSKEFYDKMFLASIEVVELRRDLEADISKQWHWYLRTIIQWHAIAYLLSELCVREPDDNVTRAWNVLDLVFQDYRNLQQHGAPTLLMAPMKKLIARARQKRAQDLEKLRAEEGAAKYANDFARSTPQVTPDVPQAHDWFPGTETLQNLQTGQTSSNTEYGGYQEQWLQQQQFPPLNTPTPWLLEDSALQDLGIDMAGLEADMEWEGLNDLMQQIEPAYGPNYHGPLGGW